MFIQETHSTKKDEKHWSAEWGGKIWFSHRSSQSCGVALMFSRSLPLQVFNVLTSETGRWIVLYLKIWEVKFVLACIYAPNQDTPQFFQNCFLEFTRFSPDQFIIAGDFNLALSPEMDWKGTHCNNDKAAEWVNNALDTHELVDAWRHFNPDVHQYTWRHLRLSPSFSRLDYIVISSTLEQFVKSVEIGYGYRSDHSPVLMQIKLNPRAKGPGYWKFNTSLLRDPDYVEKVNKLLDIELAQPFDSYKDKWELIKLMFRSSTLQYAARKKKARKNLQDALEHKLKLLEKELSEGSIFEDTLDQIRLVKHDLYEIQKQKTKGAIIHAKATWVSQGEFPTKYFLNLERNKAQKKTLFRVRNQSGRVVETENEVLAEIKDFYVNLYTSKTIVDHSYLDKLSMKQISQEARQYADRDITSEEVGLVLKQLKNSKTPATDGIAADVYKFFWKKLKLLITGLIKEIITDGKMHLTARRGIISLLDKPDKDMLKIKSWRPLTILNTDNKLYGKILANRMDHSIKDIVHFSQTGFIKGRSPSENIAKIMEIISYSDQYQQNNLLLSYDFEKAFDSLEWEALFSTLAAFNFGWKFIQMVLVLFTDLLICVSNNGFWSDFWTPSRGCRQGCTFSPLAFAVTVETLGIAIRQNKDISGIKLGDIVIKAGQFADDLWTISPNSKHQIDNILIELSHFEKFSGLRINPEKCSVLRIGPHKDSEAKFYTLKKLFWSPGVVKVLGIDISPHLNILHNRNYSASLKKVQATIERWSNRNISLFGKITIINTLLNSLFAHKFLAVPSPDESFFKEYRRMVVDFLWNKSVPRIAYKKLIQNYNKLGLKLVDLELKDLSLKASWPVKLKEREFDEIPWLYQNYPIKDKRIWDCNLNSKDTQSIVREHPLSTSSHILRAWMKLNFKPTMETKEEILGTKIYGNSLIRRGNKPIFDQKLLQSPVDSIFTILNNDLSSFLTYPQLCYMVGNTFPFIQYCSILAAIPKTWKHIIKSEPSSVLDIETTPEKWHTTAQRAHVSPSKAMYWKLVEITSPPPPPPILAWNKDLNSSLTTDEFWDLFPQFLTVVKPKKLRYLQYRVLTRSLTTNIRRNKWHKEISTVCTFCKEHPETIIHLLVSCQHVKKLWSALERTLNYFFNVSVELNPQLIVFNNYMGESKYIVNLFVVIMKQYLYASKCLAETLPSYPEFMNKMSYWYQIDKCIALETNKFKQFQSKWKNVFD